tara:strand:+ start:112 stop:1320 length:1209 start_codon:yes stop_codon:yes gene_type:complete
MISSIVDTLPISFIDFIYHFLFVFTSKKINIIDESKQRLYGSSCRSLLYTFLEEFCKNSKIKNPNILVTPLQHTSFRDIIEHFFKEDNITILSMNDEYNKIIVTDDVIKSNKNYDLCIITHLFGQDLDTTELLNINSTNNCVFMEDRVQGGAFDMIFSSELFHYSLYSCGMDKKPCALGGAILYSRPNNFKRINLIKTLELKIQKYPNETILDRIIFLIKKIPTYIIYNIKIVIWIVINIFRLIGIDLYKFITFYRKNNPGFMHYNFNIKPHNATLKSIEYSMDNIKNIESKERTLSFFFMFSLQKNNLQKKYFPWYRGVPLLTLYNTIRVKERVKFINNLNQKYIPVIDNPTYKLFNFDYSTKQQDLEFNNSLVYIPTLYTMNCSEISQLIDIIETYDKHN